MEKSFQTHQTMGKIYDLKKINGTATTISYQLSGIYAGSETIANDSINGGFNRIVNEEIITTIEMD